MDSHNLVSHQHSLVPSSHRIDDAKEYAYFLRKYQETWLLPPSVRYFAAPSPVSLERSTLERLSKEDCVVSLKTDGVRYMLLLTESEEGESVALMINRAMQMYEVEVWAHSKYFEGTGSLFDGELVWEYVNYEPRLRYIIYDVVRCAGALQTQKKYMDRMQVIFGRVLSDTPSTISDESLLDQDGIISGHNVHGLTLDVKRILPLRQLRRLWEDRSHSHHQNDGIIFTLSDCPIGINTSASIFKWKDMHTVDVLVDSHHKLHTQKGGETCPLSRVHVNGKEYTFALQHNQIVKEGILECECSVQRSCVHLFPIKARIDKASPNSIKTIERTVFNAIENIGIDELLDAWA